MDRSRLRTALEEGLTSYQTDAYLTLLDRGMASVTEVANNSSIPSSQIYDVLRALEDKGTSRRSSRIRSTHARSIPNTSWRICASADRCWSRRPTRSKSAGNGRR
ncbi:hypothetical protein D8S78_07965 [Natrialba swarupiae]|nr:hypothetical protein [Natrialba swarupiae]